MKRPFFAPDVRGAVACIIGQGSDLVTWTAFRPRELNPVVAGLGELEAVAWKIALILGLVFVAWAIGRPWGRGVLVLAAVVGTIGAVSNSPIG